MRVGSAFYLELLTTHTSLKRKRRASFEFLRLRFRLVYLGLLTPSP